MKIALIAPPWVPVPPPAYGGTEAVVDQLARGLLEQGHQVLLFAHPDSTCPVPAATMARPSDPTPIATTSGELNHVIEAYATLARMGGACPAVDLVHDHTLAGPFIGRPQWTGPLVTTNHGSFSDLTIPIFAAIHERAVPIVAISASQASMAGPVPVEAVVHHGLDLAAFPVGDGKGGYLATLARMSPTKGIDRAIRIARRAGVPLRIAAKMREPEEHEYFEAVIVPHSGGDIEYLGELGMADKLRLLGGATASLNPIVWHEPFGMAMIEALACGTPVLAHPWGSVPEVVLDGVTGFIRDDEDALAAAVADVGALDRDACRREIAQRFSRRRMTDDHVAVYRRVVRRTGSAAHAGSAAG